MIEPNSAKFLISLFIEGLYKMKLYINRIMIFLNIIEITTEIRFF